jgi:acid phosphatase class B
VKGAFPLNVSFDFDGTLHRDGVPSEPTLALLRSHTKAGDRVLIVTTRTESHERRSWWTIREPNRVVIREFVAQHRLPVQAVVFTAHQPKAATLARLGIALHYDNDPAEIALAAEIGIRAVLLNGAHPHE